MKKIFENIKTFIKDIKKKYFESPPHQYELKNIVMCVLTVAEENFLVQGMIWKLEKGGYLIKDIGNTLNNNPNKLWFVKEDDVIELSK
jgi:hypothetical protein